ncbi:cell envelope biogenesis protein OmpA [Methylobacterium sp. P1-11]|uniref:OmpA family protein n=1 Tax=Methylobacterium sp. P1-11 TaxID=2024616 RepID=UPI0011EF3D92|nr:OmpA family protein [Methylobacterium sp. P1-11]KAA0118962.1 cell envelope biogenesis protein OmpA [Methylobacterium sp. P1-11]
MHLLRLILLAGTVLPGLTLVQPASAAPGRILLAQGGPDERGPRGGEPPHGGPRPERPPQERPGPPPGPPAARERPEPRPERAAPPPRERPEPPAQRQPQAEPPPRERAPEHRPEPPAARPPAQERPAPARPGPERQQAPDRDQRLPSQPRPDPERPPAPPQQRQAPDRDRPGPDAQSNRPAPRDAAPDRTTPDRAPPSQRPGGPAGPGVPGDRPKPPGAAPAEPGGPAQRLDAQPESRQPENRTQPNTGPGAVPGRPVPPNMAPGVPGRPFQPQGAQPDGRPQAQPNGAPGAEPGRAASPNMAPGIPGRPFVPPGQAPAPGQAPPPGGPQPGMPPGQAQGGGPGRLADPGAFNRPGQPGYVPGGFGQTDAVRDFEQVRTDRREFREDGRTYYREPGRIIVQDRDGFLIRHDENERFRTLDPRGYRFERQGADFYSFVDRPGGEQVITVTNDDGRLLRRYLRYRDGREIVLIDNSYAGPLRPIYEDVVVLPPPEIRIPRDRYVVDYAQADEAEVYEALTAPPVVAIDRRYTLDQIRYSPDLRARLRSVDINTITFDTGSFTVTPDQAAKLSVIAAAMNRAIQANAQEVFLIEGFTDAVGAALDNLSLSDRRAQSVATVLTQQFRVPPENLTTQGYGEQYLKVNTQGPSRENRRVVVQRITPLLQQGQSPGQAAPPPR